MQNPFSLSEVLEGLATYARQHVAWNLAINPRDRLDEYSGAIWLQAPSTPDRILDAFGDLPAVDVMHPRGHEYSVDFDDVATGAMAAEHLLERSLERFAYVGMGNEISLARQDGFTARLRRDERDARITNSDRPDLHSGTWDEAEDRLALRKWLAGLERPTGVLAFNDQTAQVTIEEALEAGLDVPNDLAVVGVDNHFMRCEFSLISITSVDRAADQAGFEAGRMLDELLQGRTPDPARVLVEPRGVVTRRSTDMLAVKDPLVARALACIRDRACEGLSVEDLAGVMQVSRSTLEKRFRAAVAHSPHEWIRRRRLGEVRRLLRETDLPLADVAVRCGFASLQYLSAAFRRAEGIPPTQYRKRHQVG
jgi:LacI family transcriptional regulator